MNRRVYDTAVRNLVQLSDEDFERAVEEARAQRANPPEPKPRPGAYQRAFRALIRLSDREFEQIVPEVQSQREMMRQSWKGLGLDRFGDPFTTAELTPGAMQVHCALSVGAGYELALDSLLSLEHARRARAASGQEAGAVVNDSAPIAVRPHDLPSPDTEREPITLRCPQSERDSWGIGTTTAENVLPPSARPVCTR